ncbi:MAG: glycoside hydrolase family 15 [Acidimicrobiales bacterium]|nr:MAG: glycoside hydrolase family 15 [Acidimicrobiales bacterium]
MSSRPIGDYAMLSDCHSAALISGDGSVDWLCLPRFDSPSLFGALLDDDAGHWSIRPRGKYEITQSYLPESLILETRMGTPTGSARLTDALVFDAHERGHAIGRNAPHVLVRVIEVPAGAMTLDVEFAPRPEYGLVHPRLQRIAGGVLAQGGSSVLTVSGPQPTAIDVSTAHWELELRAGDRVAFAVQYSASSQPHPRPWRPKEIKKRLAGTHKGWRSWSALHQSYDGPWAQLVHHSGRVLQGLTYQPTGAIIAAPTTSLPEQIGGSRNWDYRYGWIRDASLTLNALWIAACPDEAGRFLSWIVGAAGTSMQRETGLQIMYGIGGEHDLSERELPHLRGWRDSQPVRVGNGAWNQQQLDIFGELLDAVYRLRDELGELDDITCTFLSGVADVAAQRWTEPDQGIWESRGAPQHYLYSKLMCWVALDRAILLAEQIRATDRVSEWTQVRAQIKTAILEHGWNDHVGSYTQVLSGENLDASALMLAIVGFLPASDPRMRSTIDVIAKELAAPCGLIYRYRHEDGLSGAESTFVLCTYWLAECLALAGEPETARGVFERVTAYVNDVGLLSEEVDPETGELIGNFPQAFSHVGLVNAAYAIAQAERIPEETG